MAVHPSDLNSYDDTPADPVAILSFIGIVIAIAAIQHGLVKLNLKAKTTLRLWDSALLALSLFVLWRSQSIPHLLGGIVICTLVWGMSRGMLSSFVNTRDYEQSLIIKKDEAKK